jgi:UDP-N-acetylmuramate dehydrogenase
MSLGATGRRWLAENYGQQVRFDEPMARHTYFRVGGPAEALVSPLDLESLQRLVRWCTAEGNKAFVIGAGSNLLVKDRGITGVVISLRRCLREIQVSVGGKQPKVTAQAGVNLQAFCRFCAKQGMSGMNFAVGIPGTVGGAVMMNAGTAMGTIADVIDSVGCLLWDGRTVRYERGLLEFSYRHLAWTKHRSLGVAETPIVIDGCFRLNAGEISLLQKEAADLLKTRAEKQPVDQPSAGCFFKNPADGPTAGELIDRCELKEYRIGNAQVSTKHANYIVNLGGASARDILSLMDLVRKKVADRFKVELELEVKIVGH